MLTSQSMLRATNPIVRGNPDTEAGRVMRSITGEMEAGEAQGAGAAVAARQRGSRYTYSAAVLALMAVGFAGGYGAGWLIERTWPETFFGAMPAGVVGMYLGFLVYLRLCRPWLVQRFRKHMSDRNLAVRFRQTFEVSDAGLTLESGLLRRTAPWPAVTEILRVKKYWIFLVQMEPWFAPSRFFANEADERSFIRTALGHLTEEAKARSKAAVAFAGPSS